MDVVVIGGAGLVGSMLLEPLMAAGHQVRVVDRDPEASVPEGAELRVADVTDPAAVATAVAGQEVLIYLAMGTLHPDPVEEPSTLSRTWVSSAFDVNVKGLYITVQEAAAAGVRHVVYASSLSIFEDYLARGHELEGRAPDAVDTYGLTKRLGEEVCRAAVAEHGIRATALRLCGPLPDEDWRRFRGGRPEVMTAGSDVAAAFLAAIDAAPEGFAPFVVSGDHEQRFLTWSCTRDVLGWQPRARREG